MKKILFVIITVSLMITVIFLYGIKTKENRLGEFNDSGYIIGRSYESAVLSTTKYYFNGGTKYKKDYEKNYIFANTDNENVKVSENSFIHFSDKSISVLNKTAILNLDNLNDSLIKYYNLYVGTRLVNKDNIYYTETLNNKISFTNFLMKIDENKYMIVSPKINLNLMGSNKEILNSYLEFEFFDGNIVRMENQEMQIQNVSSNFYIELSNNVKIDLSTKNIFLNNDKKLNLSQITIDKNDNIDIKKEETNANKDEKDKSNPLDGLTNGNIDVSDDEEIIDDKEKVSEPVFLISDMEVTSNKFRASIKYEDTSNLLTGDITLKIIESATNKLVYENTENSGLRLFQIEVENLKENTNYVFLVNSNYIKNAQTYNRDFIQKSFITEPIGVSIIKNYFTTDEMSYKIEVDSNTKVEGLDISLIDSNNEIIKTYTKNTHDLINNNIVDFKNLSPNTEYKVILHNFLYKNSIISDQFNIYKKYKTLKRKPSFGNLTYSLDKKNSQFNLKVNNISDVDSGVVTYKYEIYDARTLLNNPVKLKEIDKSNQGGVDLYVDNKIIFRGVPYVYKMIAIFNDNEKEFEYETEYSSVMQLDGVEFPSVRFESDEVTFEKISGNIIISDEGNTITFDESNIITVTYTDSSGNSKSFTSSGNSIIPFNVNNLRANESYTISVFAAVNLQDGNATIDNCYIGSVVIQTKPTKPFLLDYIIDEDDTTRAFKVVSRLRAENDVDNTLEASTLTNLTFNLYSGKSTKGNLIRTISKVDRDTREYYSELKDTYYDNSFILDPSFFELRNQDLQNDYYTVEVTNAYDYTTYKNNIDIISNVVTIKANGYIPDLPTDINDAMEINLIRNNANFENYRTDLNSDTIIGYKVKARYDNSKRYAKKINYYLYDANTNKLIDTKIYNVPANGEIDYVYFYLKDGTSKDIIDNDFRRGNSYYITYTVDLDLNFDGEAETIYPLEELGITLKSKKITPEKQSPIFKMYPYISDKEKVVFKYKYSDVDNSLFSNDIYYKIDNNEPKTAKINSSNNYQDVLFSVNSSGYLNLYVYENLIKEEMPSYKKLVYQYYETPYIYSGDRPLSDPMYSVKKFNINLETNRIIITILDYLEDYSFYNRVSAAKLVFKTNSASKILDNLSINNNGTIVIDIIELEDFIGEDISVEMYLYYDNGIIGFNNNNNKYAFQTIKNNLYSGYYYALDNNYLVSSETAKNSIFKFKLNSNKLSLTSLIDSKSINYDLSIDEQGYSYNYEYLYPKQLSTAKLTSSTNEFRFDTIIPGISIMSDDGKQNITPALTYALVYIDLFGNSNDRIKDNKIYIDVYETNENGTISTKIDNACKSILASELTNAVKITNLQPKKNYYIKVMADVKSGNDYKRIQLYDVNFQNNTKNYYFKTLGSVGIENINISYTAKSYSEKSLKIDYSLKEIVGYDRIEYELYRVNNDNMELINLNIEPNYVFNTEMTKYISIPPESGITTDQKYKIIIRAFTKINDNGTIKEIELEPFESAEYIFSDLRQPYIGISSNRYENGTKIDFKVNVFDYHRVIYLDTYQVFMYDKDLNDITPDRYKNQYYSTKEYNKKFELDNLVINEEYYIEIKYLVNLKNDTTSLKEQSKRYSTIAMNEDGIDIGKVYVTTNLENNTKATLVFYDSYKLSNITDIRYSIYGGDSTIDNSVEFIPKLQTNDGNSYYIFELPDDFQTKGVYYIQLQFLTNNKVVAEEALQYNYVG